MSNPNPVPNELTADNAALVRAGDTIRPKGIDETWMVAGAYDNGDVLNAGHPCSLLRRQDYTVVKRCDDAAHEDMLWKCAESEGARRSLAIAALQKMGKLPPTPPTPPTPLEAANLRIKELEEKLATKYWEPIRRENVELKEKLAKAESKFEETYAENQNLRIDRKALQEYKTDSGDRFAAVIHQRNVAEGEREALREQLQQMEGRKDGAYLERNQVVAGLAALALQSGFSAGTAKTAIEGWSEDWHGCVYIDLPTGQVSWHFHDSQAFLFAFLPPYTKSYDGHDTPEKYRRVAALATYPSPPCPKCQELEARCKGMEEAPKFYASSWEKNDPRHPFHDVIPTTILLEDKGEKARAALATISLL